MNQDSQIGHEASEPAWRLNLTMFGAGLNAMLAQILLLRELLVVFYGNELTIGAMLSAWLLLIGVGSLAIQPLLRRAGAAGWRWAPAGLLLLLAAVLPAQLWVIRVLRILLQVPYGEYVPFGAMLGATLLVLLPTGLGIGILFPCACHLRAGDERAVGRLYALEALGSLLGGVLFTFLFVQWLTPFAVMAVASLVALGSASFSVPRPTVRWLLEFLFFILVTICAWPNCLAKLEETSLVRRWQAFGCLPVEKDDDGWGLPEIPNVRWPVPRLVASLDSRYQNLALFETHGQMTLYGNGQVLGVFPDPISGEHKIHFIMAQNPAARSVLLIGGNPANDIHELLKYPLRRLVHVELDGAISRLLNAAGGKEYRRAVGDPRFSQAVADGPRYVKTSRETFDAIIVAAPQPTTIALTRFYTLEFYRAAQQRLAPGGFLYTSVEASEHLQDETAALTASIHQALQRVFPRVLVTGGMHNQYFAGMTDSPLTFDRQVLFQRSAGARLGYRYFRPEYFLNADEISPDKTEFVTQRLAEIRVPVNTTLRPISTFYQLRLWSRFSGSRLEGILAGLGRVRFDWTCAGIAIGGLVLLLIGAGLGSRRRGIDGTGAKLSLRLSTASPSNADERSCWRARLRRAAPQSWERGMLGLVMAATGCCGLALELILVYVFQSLLGYVYARIGLIVAVFMLGLLLGALWPGNSKTAGSWRMVLALDGLLAGLAIAIPILAETCLNSPALAGAGVLIEALIDVAILLAGWAVGAQFVAINQLLCAAGLSQGAAAARANAADLFGAALGGFLVGVVFLPLWGIAAACLLLAALKTASLLAALSARLAVGADKES
jgi:spermidine synthase